LAFALIYLFAGGPVLTAIIADEEARAVALAYLPYCAAVPVLGIAAWQLDGIFLGTTQSRDIAIAGVVAAALYVGTDLLLRPLGNQGVWIALLLMYVFRALCLGAFLPGLIKRLRQPPLSQT
jgi:MATE family multidrug resistance protein